MNLCHIDSPYRTHISQTVLKLQEEGKLHTLKETWWKKKYNGKNYIDFII